MHETPLNRGLRFLVARRGLVAGVLVAGVFVWAAVAGPRGLRMLFEKQEEIRSLQERNARMASENERLRVRIQRLNENKSEQEMEIRKNLKLVRPGETIFMLPEGQQPQPESAQPR